MKPLFASLALVVLAAPASAHILPAPVERAPDNLIALGQAEQLAPSLTITPVAVIEDSRCPANALCVWEGRLVIKALIDDDGEKSEKTLVLGATSRIANGMLTFSHAMPGTNTGEVLQLPDYRFGFSYAPDMAGE